MIKEEIILECVKTCKDRTNGICPPMRMFCPNKLEEYNEEIRADERRKFAEWIVNGFSVDEEWYPGRIAERKVFLVNSYTDSNGYCRCNEKNILSSDEIIAEYEKEQR